MRMKIMNVLHLATQWIQALLEVRLPMGVAAGLRTR